MPKKIGPGTTHSSTRPEKDNLTEKVNAQEDWTWDNTLKYKARKGQFDDHDKVYKKKSKKRKSSRTTKNKTTLLLNTDFTKNEGHRAFTAACENGQKEIVDLMMNVSKEVDLNASDHGYTDNEPQPSV